MGLFSKKDRCPACGHEVKVLRAPSPPPVRCAGCSRESAYSGGRLAVIGPGFIGDQCVIGTTKTNTLVPPGEWRLPWPMQCSVCRAQATRTEDVFITMNVGFAPPSFVKTAKWTFKVPHCSKHNFGVFLINLPGNENKTISFRSFDYYEEFMSLNAC